MLIYLIKDLFNYIPGVYAKKKHGFNKKTGHQITISSKGLVLKLAGSFNMPFGKKSHKLRVPKCILNSTKKNKANFLRGLIDGDGSIKKCRIISLCSASKAFLKDINKILNDLDIDSKRVLASENIYLVNIANKKDLNQIYARCYKNQDYCYPRKIMSLEKIIFKSEELDQDKVLA